MPPEHVKRYENAFLSSDGRASFQSDDGSVLVGKGRIVFIKPEALDRFMEEIGVS